MSIQGWQVITWPTVEAKSRELLRAIPRFKHLGTSLQIGTGSNDHCTGSTVWGCDYMGKQVGLAWEWVEVRPRVVAMGDPMVLLSNVELHDAQDEPMEIGPRLLALHQIIYGLPWQKLVVDARWHAGEQLLAA